MCAKPGFTLIELIIVLTILAIVAAVAIPTYQNMQTQAKNAAIKGILGGVRSALLIYRVNEIASGRVSFAVGDPYRGWPAGHQVRDLFDGGTQFGLPHVLQNGDLPDNPWAVDAGFQPVDKDNLCWQYDNPELFPRGSLVDYCNPSSGTPAPWVYNEAVGEFWANTAANGGTLGVDTENMF